uniref:Uncharacterized protein n=1 Tax=Knipowitschia caucasica TaxID=637954 RepID=A0AAV2M5X1_KNICA
MVLCPDTGLTEQHGIRVVGQCGSPRLCLWLQEEECSGCVVGPGSEQRLALVVLSDIRAAAPPHVLLFLNYFCARVLGGPCGSRLRTPGGVSKSQLLVYTPSICSRFLSHWVVADEGGSKLHSPHSARPGQEHSWPDLVEPVDRRMERSPPRARFLRKHAQSSSYGNQGGSSRCEAAQWAAGARLSLASLLRGSGRRDTPRAAWWGPLATVLLPEHLESRLSGSARSLTPPSLLHNQSHDRPQLLLPPSSSVCVAAGLH